MIKLVLEIECEDDTDVNDLSYMLFGPHEECAKFGDEVTKHAFSFRRENGKRVGRPRKEV